jgi:hypothetical protein
MSEQLWTSDQRGEGAQLGGSPQIAPSNSIWAAGALLVPESDAPPIGPANKTCTLDAVLAQISEREEGLRRDRIPLNHVRVESDRLVAGDKEFRLVSEGLHRLYRRFQAPASYLDRPTIC